jgi:hypothetical protein
MAVIQPGRPVVMGPAPEPAWLAADDRPVVLVRTPSEFQDDGALAKVAVATTCEQSSPW